MRTLITPLLLLLALGAALPAQSAEGAGELDQEALVRRIRETLGRIDEALLDTSEASDVRAGLADVREKHLQVIRDLEALIKQQKYRQGGSGGGGGESSQNPSEGSSGQQQQPSERNSDGSEAPRPGEQGTQPPASGEEQQEQPGQESPEEAEGSRPQDGAARDESAGANRPADGPPPEDPIAPVTREDTDERWGLLPPKLQERLMNLHVDDVPARYRTWMEAYVRSMHALENRDGAR